MAPANATTAPIAANAAAILGALLHAVPSGMRYLDESWVVFCSLTSLLPGLAELQSSHVAHDRPAIVDWDRIVVRRHVAHAVADGRKQLAVRHVTHSIVRQVGRRREPALARPYRTWGYPAVPAIFVILAVLFLANTFAEQRSDLLWCLALMASGVPAYLLWQLRRRRL